MRDSHSEAASSCAPGPPVAYQSETCLSGIAKLASDVPPISCSSNVPCTKLCDHHQELKKMRGGGDVAPIANFYSGILIWSRVGQPLRLLGAETGCPVVKGDRCVITLGGLDSDSLI